MNTCKTCRFRAEPRYPNDKHSHCVRIIHGNGDDETWDGKPVNPDKEKAYVTDGSGYAASLRVREDFGCVLHEPGKSVAPSGSADR